MSILSKATDGLNFYYGFVDGDHRQINVRIEGQSLGLSHWKAYVGGELVPNSTGAFDWPSKDAAEAAAIKWAKANPPGQE